MNKTEFNHSFGCVEDLLSMLGYMPADKSFKEMLYGVDDINFELSVRSPEAGTIEPAPSFKNLVEAMKYSDSTHFTESDYLEAARDFDRKHSKTRHGKMSDGHNLFARAFISYTADKLAQQGRPEAYVYPEYDSRNLIWYSGYSQIRPNLEMQKKLFPLFDNFIEDMKERKMIKSYALPDKMTMDDVKNIVDRRKKQKEGSSQSYVASRKTGAHPYPKF